MNLRPPPPFAGASSSASPLAVSPEPPPPYLAMNALTFASILPMLLPPEPSSYVTSGPEIRISLITTGSEVMESVSILTVILPRANALSVSNPSGLPTLRPPSVPSPDVREISTVSRVTSPLVASDPRPSTADFTTASSDPSRNKTPATPITAKTPTITRTFFITSPPDP